MQKYTKKFALIHWIHAILLALLLIGAQASLPNLPETGGDLSPFKMHIIMGVIAMLLLFVRLYMLKNEEKIKIYDNSKQLLVDWNHRLIYIMIFIVALSGMVVAKLSNLGSVALFGNDASNYTGVTPTIETFATVHSVGAKILMALIIVHIIGVVLYIIQTKEKIIKKMWF